jgi:serine acetyltransferase
VPGIPDRWRSDWAAYTTSVVRPARQRASFRQRVRSDWAANPGLHLDATKARLLLTEFRLEQSVFEWRIASPGRFRGLAWAAVRFAGSVFQWRLFNCEIAGSLDIGLGLRLPHPQNIIIAYTASLGDWCSVYHNVTIGRSTLRAGNMTPKVGHRVLLGSGAIVLGDITIGDDAVIGAGVVVTEPVPAAHLVINPHPEVRPRASLAGGFDDVEFAYANPHPRARPRTPSAAAPDRRSPESETR